MKGRCFAGRYLWVDLTRGEVKKTPLDEETVRSYIGGFGICAKLALEMIPPGLDPLSPQNPILLGAGMLSGTMIPGSARLAMVTKLPEVNAVFAGSGSMSFAAKLKYAGYDQLIITGRAEKPAYLYIEDGRVEIRDAQELWGRDLYQATDALWEKHSRSASVIAIGQGGERQLPISLTLIDKIGAMGNKGGAAVFGSKNLKAVVVKGSGGIAVHNPGKFIRLVNTYLSRAREDPFREKWVEQGIMSKWSGGDWSYKNRDRIFPGALANELVGTEVYLEKAKKGRLACPACPYADKEILGVGEGEFEGLKTYSSGWARANEQFGILCQVGGYEKVVKCLDQVQRYGLCRHAVSAAVDYAVYLYEQGVITRRDTDGRELRRDYDTTATLIEWMISGHSIGAVLGRGPTGLARAYGRDERQEVFGSKGTTITDDPRLQGLQTMNFEFIVNPKGHHSHCWSPMYSKENPDRFRDACARLGIPGDAVSRILDSATGFNVGRLTRHVEDWHALSSSLGLCQRFPYDGFWSLSDYRDLFSTATGIDLTPEELMLAGERAWNAYRMINVRDGFDRARDTYPLKWLQPLETKDGGKIFMRNKYDGRVVEAGDLDRMIGDYYEERGWDRQTGIPSQGRLETLGLVS